MLIRFAIGALLFTGVAQATKYCYRTTEPRGAGTIPLECASSNTELKLESDGGLLCYPTCKTGYTGLSFLCWQNGCPEGFRDDGAFCAKPLWSHEYRGTSYFSQGSCEADYPPAQAPHYGCETCGWVWSGIYPKCTLNRTVSVLSCNFCDHACWPDQTDIGASCAKHTERRDAIPTTCPSNMEKDAGLCYRKCSDPSFTGVGPVCWQANCPVDKNGHQWVGCGVGCAYDTDTCAGVTTDQVFTVLETAYNIFETASTAGTNQAANAAGKKAAQKKVRDELKDWFKGELKSYAKEQAKEASKTIFRDAMAEAMSTDPDIAARLDETGRKLAVDNAGEAGGMLYDLVMGEIDPYEAAGLNATSKLALLENGKDIPSDIKEAAMGQVPELETGDFLSFLEASKLEGVVDPFGVIGVIKAYKHVLCDDESIIGKPTTTPRPTTRPTTTPTQVSIQPTPSAETAANSTASAITVSGAVALTSLAALLV